MKMFCSVVFHIVIDHSVDSLKMTSEQFGHCSFVIQAGLGPSALCLLALYE